MLLHRPIQAIERRILKHPGTVAAGFAIAVAVALILGAGVEFRTSRSDLAPPDDPEQVRFSRLLSEWTGSEPVVACVHPADPSAAVDPEAIRAFADRLAAAYRDAPEAGAVFWRIDLGAVLDAAPWIAPPATVRRVIRRVTLPP